MESILLLNIYRNIKFNIKFFPQDKILTGKNYVVHMHVQRELLIFIDQYRVDICYQ